MDLYGGIVLYNSATLLQKFVSRRWLISTFVLMISSLFTGVTYIKNKHMFFGGDYLLRVVLGAVLITFLMCLLMRLSIFNKINLFLGKVSYEVYLVHGFVFNELERICDEQFNSAVFILLSIVITVTISIFIHILSDWIYKQSIYIRNILCRKKTQIFDDKQHEISEKVAILRFFTIN